MNEYNTKITYYHLGDLQRWKTIKAHARFYLAYYAKLLVLSINERLNDEKRISKLRQTAN